MSIRKQLIVILAAAAFGFALMAPAGADDRGQRRAASQPTARQLTAEAEREALAFAAEHYEQLADVLKVLRRTRPRQYRAAVGELARTVRRLKGLRRRDPQRYKLELELWRAEMKVKLLAARLGMGDDPALEDELRQAIRAQVKARIALQKLLRERLARRLRELDENIRRSETALDREVEQRLKRLKGTVRTVRSRRRRTRSTADAPSVRKRQAAATPQTNGRKTIREER